MQQMYNILGGPIKPSSSLVLPLELWSENMSATHTKKSHGAENCINSKMVKKNARPRYEVSVIDPPIQPTNGICGVCILGTSGTFTCAAALAFASSTFFSASSTTSVTPSIVLFTTM